MADDKPQPSQKTQPKGKDKRTGKPAEPMEIPVPKHDDFESLLRKVTGSDTPGK